MISYRIIPTIDTTHGSNIAIWSDMSSEVEQVWNAFQSFGKVRRDPSDNKRLIVSTLSSAGTELYKRALQRMGAIEIP